MIWNESDSWRVAHWCHDYDAIPFIWQGEYGLQPVLMPHKVYPWRKAEQLPTKPSRTSSKPSR
jgi:hypothetical protein